MADKLLREFRHKLGSVRLAPGGKGTFEVSIDGNLVFSKLEHGRFPDLKEIREALQAST